MSDQPGAMPLGLLQQQAAKPVDPAQLEMMGKRAAAAHTDCGTPLSEAVAETVKEARLAPEQVKRVCEFANNAAYLSEFEKAGEVRNVTFDGGPADPGEVLRSLNDGSAPPPLQKTAAYAPPTGHYKTAGASDQLLQEMFGASLEKTASVDLNHSIRANPADEVFDLKTQLEGARDHLMSKLSSSGVLYEDVQEDLALAVKHEILEKNASMGDIVQIWSRFTPNTFMLKQAMIDVGQKLQSSGLGPKELGKSLQKTASAGNVPNPNHPLVERFIAFTKVAHEHRKLERAVEDLDEQLSSVNSQLQRTIQ